MGLLFGRTALRALKRTFRAAITQQRRLLQISEEQHDSEGGANGSGGQVGCESGQNGSSVSVAGGNAAPDGLNPQKRTLNLFSAFPECVL